jgi:ABC-2 type transport system permease protein
MPFNQIVSGQFIAPVEPPEAAPPQMRMPAPPPKGNIEFFVRGLGLEWDKGEVLWSRYNPSVALRQLGPHFIWLNAERGSVAEDHPITSGIDSLMTIYSSLFTKAVEHEEGLQIFPLLAPNPDVEWGVHHYNDLILRDPYPRLAEVGRDVMLQPTRDRFEPMIAAEIRGTPKHIYDERNAESEGAEKAEQEGDVEEAAQVPIHVVAIADTDLASSIFFQFYRDIDGSVSASDNAILASLRNVQFMSNALDSLMGDEAMVSLRGRRPSHRTLTRMEALYEITQRKRDTARLVTASKKEKDVEAAQKAHDNELAVIDQRDDLDALQKENLKATVGQAASRRLQTRLADIDREEQADIDRAEREQRLAFEKEWMWVKVRGIGAPAAIILILVILVVALRLRREMKDIPTARSRRIP